MIVWVRKKVRQFIETWPIGFVLGCTLFSLGIVLLRHNPIWPRGPFIPTSYFLWNAFAHLVCTIGLLCGFLSLLNGISMMTVHKKLFWCGIAAIWITVLATGGTGHNRTASFTWNEREGFTHFRVPGVQRYFSTLVRWQVEPELDHYLRMAHAESTDGEFMIRVGSVVPMASTDLNECWSCMSNTVWKSDR